MATPLAPPTVPRSAPASRLWLPAILLGAFLLRLAVATLLPTLHRPDEVFENLEPAFRMLTGQGIVTWEWHEGIRSSLYPAFLAALMGMARAVGAGPSGYLGFVAAVLSLISLGTVAIGFDLGRRQAGLAGGIVCGVLCAVWPDLVYFGPKPLAEIQAGNLLIVAAYLAARSRAPGPHTWVVAATGFMLGLVFCVRFHLAPAMAAAALWCCRGSLRRWLVLVAGGLGPVLAFGLVDFLSLGAPYISIWRNVQVNLSQAVSQEFGTQPVTWYAAQWLSQWGAALVPLGLTFVFGARRAPLLAIAAALVALSHSAISHKEISFLYAAIPPLIVVCGLGTVDLASRLLAPGHQRGAQAATLAAFWVATSATTALSGGFKANWRANAGIVHAEQALAAAPSLCGLGIRWPQLGWYSTGGDVSLGHGVPMYAFGSPAGARRVAPAVNYVLGGPNAAEGLPGFAVTQCWNNPDGPVCLARTERTTCVADPGFELDNVPGLGRMSTRYGADTP